MGDLSGKVSDLPDDEEATMSISGGKSISDSGKRREAPGLLCSGTERWRGGWRAES